MVSSNDECTLHTQRIFSASPEEVFAAFSDAEALSRWWGPEGFTNAFHVCDFVEGGRWEFDMLGPDGHRHANVCVFDKLERDRTVVIRHVSAPCFTLSITLTSYSGGTHLAWSQTFDDPKTAASFRRIAAPGNEQNLDRLQRLLQDTQGN